MRENRKAALQATCVGMYLHSWPHRLARTKKLNAMAAPRRATTVVASNSKSTVSSFGFTEGDPSSLSDGGLIFGACMEAVAVRGVVEPYDTMAGLSAFGNAGETTRETANDGSMARARTATPFILVFNWALVLWLEPSATA